VKVAVYISGHGFGHLAQIAPVLERLYTRNSGCRLLIRCALPAAEIRARLRCDVEFELDTRPVDVGVVQRNAIEEDRGASVRRMRDWVGRIYALVDAEIACLRRFRADLVLSNISPLAFPATAAIGVPAIGLATLDWHTIYSHWLAPDDPVIRALARAYRDCDLLLTPPMAMRMPVFKAQHRIGLIAAHPDRATDLLVGSLVGPLEEGNGRKRALVLFGGCDHPPYDMQALAAMDQWLLLIPDAGGDKPENVIPVAFSAYLRPVDLMPYVDVVLCKPGYGVLSECWRTATPIAWVERPDFPEFPMLRGWLAQQLPAAGMTRGEFRSGRWLPALRSALACERRFSPLSDDGANQAAAIIAAYLQL